MKQCVRETLLFYAYSLKEIARGEVTPCTCEMHSSLHVCGTMVIDSLYTVPQLHFLTQTMQLHKPAIVKTFYDERNHKGNFHWKYVEYNKRTPFILEWCLYSCRHSIGARESPQQLPTQLVLGKILHAR